MGVLVYDLLSLLGSASWSLRFKSSVRKMLSIRGCFCSKVFFFPVEKAGDTFAAEGEKDLSGKVFPLINKYYNEKTLSEGSGRADTAC